MKVDRYTQAILTVIAVCLVVLTVKELIPSLYAENTTASPGYATVPLNEDGSIDVVIKSISPNEVMDVSIVDVDTYDKLKVDLADISTYDELDVNVDEVGGSSVSSGGPIRVEMK